MKYGYSVYNGEISFENESKKTQKKGIEYEKIWEILDEIKKKFTGQEKAVEDLFYNIVNNQQIIQEDNLSDGDRSIIFLDGPTGTGKTAITREITKMLDIPFISTSVNNYSSTGCAGGNLTDLLVSLLKESKGDLRKAEQGIIVLDEFDKLTSFGVNSLEMKRAVQQQLLDFLGGGSYNISIDKNLFDTEEVTFDTSKITFVCLAALTNLRDNKIFSESKKVNQIGFGNTIEKKQLRQDYSITPEDLMRIGLEKELVGRFNTYLHTEEYSKESLFRILTESPISPLNGFNDWIKANNKELIIGEGVCDLIVEQAYKLNTGARSLQTVMNTIRTHYLKDVLRGKEDTIYLDSETINKIIGDSINRKGRV